MLVRSVDNYHTIKSVDFPWKKSLLISMISDARVDAPHFFVLRVAYTIDIQVRECVFVCMFPTVMAIH